MKTHIDPNAVFPEVEQMLYALAWKFVRKYPQLEFEDVKSQAYWGFLQAVRLWNPCKAAKFSTWCYQVTYYFLQNLVMDNSKDAARLSFVEIDDDLCGAAPEPQAPYRDVLHTLSQDAREIVSLLLDSPKEIAEELTPKQLFSAVKKHLLAKGRCQKRLKQAEQEITMQFRSVWNQTLEAA